MNTEKFLTNGVHIGTQRKLEDMRRFVYKIRPDGLCVLDVETIGNRIEAAAKLISKYEPSSVLVVAGREYAQAPSKKFAELTGARAHMGRFMPGTMTNPNLEYFIEPEIIIVADPLVDRQAIKEAVQIGIPIISFCDTNNETKNVDLIIPGNNKGRKSLATLYHALTQQVLIERGLLSKDSELDTEVDVFMRK